MDTKELLSGEIIAERHDLPPLRADASVITQSCYSCDQGGKGVPVIHLLVPLAAHRRLIGSCDCKSPEHKLLTNGVIETDSAGEKRVRLLCDDGRCEKILSFVRCVQPQLERSIEKVVVSDRTGPY